MDEIGMARRDLMKILAALGLTLGDAKAQAPVRNATTVDPRSFHVIAENDRVRIVEHVSRPRMGVCGTGMHSHPDHVTIVLTDLKAAVTLADGSKRIVESKAGDAFFEPAITHSVENVGGRDARSYLIELKKA